MGSFPARVWIDDKCDCCGSKDRMGVSWGYKAPVLCEMCLTLGAMAVFRGHPVSPDAGPVASLARREIEPS